jgi:hypothetical protein
VKNLLLAAAAATLVIGAVPAFASPANDAEWNITPQAPAATCHFVREPVTYPTAAWCIGKLRSAADTELLITFRVRGH